jgi:hypothetical protein
VENREQDLTVMDFVAICPPAVVDRVRETDLTAAAGSTLFSWIASQSELQCQIAALEAVAKRLKSTSHPQVIDDFAASAATYARFLTPEVVDAVRVAFEHVPYSEAIAANYFLALRLNRIDLRDHLRAKVREDWSFEHPNLNAATWHYYMYLASLGETGALERLAGKIADTANGNDATNLLQSLSELKAEGVDEVLRSYLGDKRTADATEGPGPTIAESVRNFLMMREMMP